MLGDNEAQAAKWLEGQAETASGDLRKQVRIGLKTLYVRLQALGSLQKLFGLTRGRAMAVVDQFSRGEAANKE